MLSRLYRSRHAKRTTKVALVKATKLKANPSTNEVRVENRNYGLAWSQSGNQNSPNTVFSFSRPTSKAREKRPGDEVGTGQHSLRAKF